MISTVMFVATAQANDVTIKPIRPSNITFLRPNRSDREPAIKINEPSVNKYASTIHCWPARPPPSSRDIAGKATFTTDESKKATNEAKMLTAKTRRKFLFTSNHDSRNQSNQ